MKRKTLDAIRAHYAHALARHPKFCDHRHRAWREAQMRRNPPSAI